MDDASSEVLSQTEVESILASIQTGESVEEVKVYGGSGKVRNTAAHSVQAYDFRSPVYLNPSQMRRLRIKHEDYIRGLAATLSLYLRMDFSITMSRLETISYRALLEILPMPSHLTLFNLKPLKGVCLFDISPRLGLTVIDRMLGGPGHSVKIEREFTDMEVTVLENFIRLVLKEYCECWLNYQHLESEITQHENTARFLNIVDHDEIMLYLEMEARFGDCVAGMRFIIPYHMIEHLVEMLMKEISANEESSRTTVKLPTDKRAPSYNIPVPISAHWEGLKLSLGEIQNLQSGDILMLENKVVEKAVIALGNLPKFIGRVDLSDQKVKLQITSKTND